MTFADMKQALYDALGLTGESTMMARFVNEGMQEFVNLAKPEYLQTSSSVAFSTSTKAYALGTDVGEVSEIYLANGNPLTLINKGTFSQLYRGTTTSTVPDVFCIEGGTSTGGTNISVWPTPSASTTATLTYRKRVPDMSVDTSSPQFIPPEHHFMIVQAAQMRFRDHEGETEAAMKIRQDLMTNISRATGGQVNDGA